MPPTKSGPIRLLTLEQAERQFPGASLAWDRDLVLTGWVDGRSTPPRLKIGVQTGRLTCYVGSSHDEHGDTPCAEAVHNYFNDGTYDGERNVGTPSGSVPECSDWARARYHADQERWEIVR